MKTHHRKYVVLNKEADFQKGQGFQVEIGKEGIRLCEDALWGSYFSRVWDSREKKMMWHGIKVTMSKGSSASLTVSVYTSETPVIVVEGEEIRLEELLLSPLPPEEMEKWMEPCLAARIEHPMDALLTGVTGRYLWLSFHFFRREEETPVITGVRVEFPRSSWMSYLPEIYQREQGINTFTERYLAVFQKLSEELTDQIEAVPAQMEPESADESSLKWLAKLFAIEEFGMWKQEQLRGLLAHAVELYRIRGTVRYLKEIIRLHTGMIPFLVEYHQAAGYSQQLSDGRRAVELYCSHPYEFALLLPEREASDGNEDKILQRMVDLAKPMEMECRILILKPYIFLDQYSYLGINSILGRYQPARLDGLCAVPFTTVPESERKGGERR